MDQIFWRVAGKCQFGNHQHVSPGLRGIIHRLGDLCLVTADVAHPEVHLRTGDTNRHTDTLSGGLELKHRLSLLVRD